MEQKVISVAELVKEQDANCTQDVLSSVSELKAMFAELKAMVANAAQQPDLVNADEAAKFLGISKGTLYKLTMNHSIPFYKPMGKFCYFSLVELEKWIRDSRVSTTEEMTQKAQSYTLKKGGRLC